MTFFRELRADREHLYLVHEDRENNPCASECELFFGDHDDLFNEYQIDEVEGWGPRDYRIWYREATMEEVKYILHVWIPARASNIMTKFCNFNCKAITTHRKLEDLLDLANRIRTHYGKAVVIEDGDEKLLAKVAAEDRLEKNAMYWISPRRPGDEEED